MRITMDCEDRYNKIIKLMYKEVDIYKYIALLNHILENQQKLLGNIYCYYSILTLGQMQ